MATSDMTRIYVLLGGFFGWDGPVVSPGMLALAKRLAALPNVQCDTWNWSSYLDVHRSIGKLSVETRRVLIGYSGGGSRATYIANENPRPRIDLIVGYDPSPAWQMQPLGTNVIRALCYRNLSPKFFGYGGGVMTGKQVETILISRNHAAVQSDETLHARTIAAVSKLITS